MVSAQSHVRYPEGHRPSDPNEFHFSPGLAVGEPAVDVHPRQRYFGSGGVSRNRPSVGRSAFRAIACALSIIAIAGVPLAWQFSDDNTKGVVRAWGKAWGISPNEFSAALGAKSSAASAETVSKTFDSKTLDQASTGDTSGRAERVTPAAPAPVAARPSPELQHHLEALVSDLAVVRRSVEQLAANQEQMAQELTTLRAAQQNISQKSSPVSQSAAVHVPPHKNAPRPVPAGAPPQSSSVPIPTARPGEPLPLH
jgi:hypothetical protein